MVDCGTQITLCDFPVRVDMYKGCSHGCKYCFVSRKYDIKNIQINGKCSLKAVENFINGRRAQVTSWCDWKIPLHWGGVSDPFQPIEKKYRLSLKLLELFAATQYPFIVSTKGELIAEEPYITLLGKCNAVVQISMVCEKLDSIERGAPSFNKRLKIIEKIAPKVKRLNVRCQPYFVHLHKEIKNNLPTYAKLGVHGVIFEGYKSITKINGMERLGADFVYSKKTLKEKFSELKELCHKNGLKFYSGENRLRNMGDSLGCCGADGLSGFEGNKYNINHNLYDKNNFVPTKAMFKVGTAQCFKAFTQDSFSVAPMRRKSYKELMDICIKDRSMLKPFLGV
jgi:DNA repair photolyase